MHINNKEKCSPNPDCKATMGSDLDDIQGALISAMQRYLSRFERCFKVGSYQPSPVAWNCTILIRPTRHPCPPKPKPPEIDLKAPPKYSIRVTKGPCSKSTSEPKPPPEPQPPKPKSKNNKNTIPRNPKSYIVNPPLVLKSYPHPYSNPQARMRNYSPHCINLTDRILKETSKEKKQKPVNKRRFIVRVKSKKNGGNPTVKRILLEI